MGLLLLIYWPAVNRDRLRPASLDSLFDPVMTGRAKGLERPREFLGITFVRLDMIRHGSGFGPAVRRAHHTQRIVGQESSPSLTPAPAVEMRVLFPAHAHNSAAIAQPSTRMARPIRLTAGRTAST